jgi:glutaredoxin
MKNEKCDYCERDPATTFLLGSNYLGKYTKGYCQGCYKAITIGLVNDLTKWQIITYEEFLIAQVMLT